MIDIISSSGLTVFLITAVTLILAITVHEFSHGFAAEKLGDPTPRLQGRLSLNPMAHLDPLGTIMLFLFGFGWGKPVLFDPFNLKNPRKDAAIISFAGPLSNIIMAVIASLIVRLLTGAGSSYNIVADALSLFVYFNLILAFFNLIPIHPLDGGKIFIGLLPKNEADEANAFLKRYGLIILILLIMPIFGGRSPIFSFLSPLVGNIMNILLP